MNFASGYMTKKKMLKTYWKWLKITWSGLFILSLWNKDVLLACCFQQLSWERFSFFMVHRSIYLRDNIVWSLVCLKFEFYFILFYFLTGVFSWTLQEERLTKRFSFLLLISIYCLFSYFILFSDLELTFGQVPKKKLNNM